MASRKPLVVISGIVQELPAGDATKRVGTVASSATPAINADLIDYFSITALTQAITGFVMSGTPYDGQTLWISITDNGISNRNITWGSSFEASTVGLPTQTVLGVRLDTGHVFNGATGKWRIVAVA